MIKPTVGRIVWFYSAGDPDAQPLAAIVAHVWNERMVNLMVVDAKGEPHGVISVDLLQDDDEPHGAQWCEWMPYQLGQAAKTEAALAAQEKR